MTISLRTTVLLLSVIISVKEMVFVSCLVKQTDGTYTEQTVTTFSSGFSDGVSFGTGQVCASGHKECLREVIHHERWTDYPENGGKKIERISDHKKGKP